jgi:hypothetical protein
VTSCSSFPTVQVRLVVGICSTPEVVEKRCGLLGMEGVEAESVRFFVVFSCTSMSVDPPLLGYVNQTHALAEKLLVSCLELL